MGARTNPLDASGGSVFRNEPGAAKGALIRAAASTVRRLHVNRKEVHMKTTLLLLMMCMAVVGQSKDELRKKYREPVSETFVVRPGIIATASYSSTGQVTELLIAPQLTDLIKSKSKGL